MKKLVLIAAVTIASATAFASKARLDALSDAAHISDTEEVIAKPDQAVVLPEFATLNFGRTNVAAGSTDAAAEGGFIRKMDGAAWGLYLGKRPAGNAYRVAFNTAGLVSTASNTLLEMENGLNAIYAMDMGDLRWGAGLYYSNSNKKSLETSTSTTRDRKQDASGLYLSASSTAGWDAQLSVGIANNASYNTIAGDTTQKIKGNTTATVSGGYWMDTMYFYGSYGMGGAKFESDGTTLADRKDQALKIGVVNSHKKDGTDFFYGVSYVMQTLKDDSDNAKNTRSSIGATDAASANKRITKRESTTLPVVLGVEHDAMSWLVLRGSVTQNVLYSAVKDSSDLTNADGTNTVDANTVVAAGIGLKFNKFILDGTFAKANGDGSLANSGAVGSDANFLTKAALTYMF